MEQPGPVQDQKKEERIEAVGGTVMLFFAFAFLALQLVYNLSIVEQVPDATEATHIRVVNEGSSVFFLLPLFIGLLFVFFGFGVLMAMLMTSDKEKRRELLIVGPILTICLLAAWLAIPASWNNAWVDFDSQVVVERDTYLFPRPNVDHRTSFSDIDYILWEVDEGDVLLVKRDRSEFKLYDSAFGEEGQRLTGELSDLMNKPLEVVEHG